MSLTLYRKYRPQTFTEVVGQHHIKTTLEQEVKMNRLAHAYLFCGPRGVGKTTLARIMAKTINCAQRDSSSSEPCNACESCTAMNESRSLNLIEIDAASHRGINEIRELREHVKFFPQQGLYKIFIIDEVHMLTSEAFNALLKTLEEPPAHALFILATTEVHKLPETIISRCQRFDFKKLPSLELKKRLLDITEKEHASIEEDIIDTLILRAEGCGRDAESMLGQLLSLGTERITWKQAELVLPRSDRVLIEQWIESVLSKNTQKALTLIQQLVDEGVDMERFVQDTIMVVRQNMMSAIAVNDTDNGQKYFHLLDRLIQRLPDIRKMAEMPHLPLELVSVEIALQMESGIPSRVTQPSVPLPSPQPGPGAALIHEPLKTYSSAPAKLSESGVSERWEEVLDYIQTHAPSLSFVLGVAQPISVQDDTITIAFSYKFHQDIINSPKNKAVVQKALQHVFGRVYTIRTVATEDTGESKDPPHDDILAIAVETFEGAVADV
ncbi:MAG TPA: DNA polymerase III subunit gamma/tau [Patescibacteria group bacterium]|nr:DNA polymerase III subunit gamma/tau [Patescibacteria group bacterium]